MKFLFFILTACSCLGQALPLPFINPSTGGGGKNFVVVQSRTNTSGSSITITPTAGNAIIVFGESSSSSTITVSDGVNTYTTITNQNVSATQGIAAWAKNVSSSTVTVALSGAVNPGLYVYEVSGLTAVDAVAATASASNPATLTLPATTSSDFAMIFWVSEAADYAGNPTASLSPGSLSGNLLSHDSSLYGAFWDWGAGSGISANTYTATIGTPNGNAAVIGIAWR